MYSDMINPFVLINPTNRSADQSGKVRVGNKRKLRMNLDCRQYYEDVTKGNNCYETFNILLRRNPKENNFKSVLETIKTLANTGNIDRAVPAWLYDVLLGNGDPTAASSHHR